MGIVSDKQDELVQDLLYNIVSIVNDNILYSKNVLRIELILRVITIK